MEQAEALARACHEEYGTPMVWGWQTNDATGEREPGYCPRDHVGPSFVHTVVGRVPEEN